MKTLATTLLALALTACASPEYVARQSNWDVCRLSMGGPHSAAAEAEARSRGIDCAPLYPAIQGQLATQNAATQTLLRSMQQRPMPPLIPAHQDLSCYSSNTGLGVVTNCH